MPNPLSSYPLTVTKRQLEVLTLLANGRTYKQISLSLRISVPSIKVHVYRARARLGASTREEAVAKAVGAGLIIMEVQA